MKFLLLFICASASIIAMDNQTLNKLFDVTQCTTTNAALRYARTLYALSPEITLSMQARAILMQKAWQVIEYPYSNTIKGKARIQELEDCFSYSQPAISESGQFYALPTSQDTTRIYDAYNGKYIEWFIASSYVRFLGNCIVATAKYDGSDQLMLQKSIKEDQLEQLADKPRCIGTPIISHVCALDVAHDGTIATAHNGDNSDAKIVLYATDVATQLTEKSVYTLSAPVAEEGFKWHPEKNIFAVKLKNNTVRLYDCRSKTPIVSIPDVHNEQGFDFSEDGSYLCASTWPKKTLMIYEVAHQRKINTPIQCYDRGIITNIGNDCFSVTTHFYAGQSTACDFLTFNTNQWLSLNQMNSHVLSQMIENLYASTHDPLLRVPQNCRMQGHRHYVQNGEELYHLVAHKKTGQQLFHYRTDEKSFYLYSTSNYLYNTRLSNPEPYNVAALYALQRAESDEDWAELASEHNRAVIQGTCEKDSVFAQCIKMFAPAT